jgi:hypothetical protein
MAGVLTLAGIPFLEYSPPERMPAGGRQDMVVHKLPGGNRVIDTLGPDERNISWSGQFFSDTALDDALAIDAVRQAGAVVPLTFAGQFRSVIVANFEYDIRREPLLVEYRIECVVYQNPMLGPLGLAISSVTSLVSADLGLALSIGP